MSENTDVPKDNPATKTYDVKARPLFNMIYQYKKSQDFSVGATQAMGRVLAEVNSITNTIATVGILSDTAEEEPSQELIQNTRAHLCNVRVGMHIALGLLKESTINFNHSKAMTDALFDQTYKEK